MSPSLLTSRLRALEKNGLITRTQIGGAAEYEMTEAGRETLPIVQLFGLWGHRWLHERNEPDDLDEAFLVYSFSAALDRSALGRARVVIQISFTDQPKIEWPNWWLIVTTDEVDMCAIDPGFDVDVYVEGDLRTLYHLNHGVVTHRQIIDEERVSVTGDMDLVRSFSSWFRGSPFSTLPQPPTGANAAEVLSKLSS